MSMLEFRVTEQSSQLQGALRTKALDLCSLSSRLSMQPAFIRVFDELYPLLRELGNEGQATAEAAKRRLMKLKAQHELLGRPMEARDLATREYLAKVQAFGKELQDRVLALCPLEIDLSYSRRAGLR